ncbi:MAG: class I SAM-dependent methyltransferase [Acidobacteriota bacterium]|nr:class I SAM-dependent methyltransferase [Acidobacteriota bacterium]
MNCPLCSSDSREIFAAKGFPVRDCAACGHRFAEVATNGGGSNHIAEIYDDSYFNGGGAGYSDYLAEGEMLRRRGRDYAKILSRYTAAETGKILDVGAAAGFILQGFCDAGWCGTGVEPNASMARAGREKFALEIFEGDFENFRSAEKFDAVSMIQVAAHFHNPRRAFGNAFDLLKPGGVLLVETWNYKSLTARVFGRAWHEYSPPSVLHWFSPETLSGFLQREVGFEKLAQGRPSKKISGEHAKSLLRYRLGNKFDSFLKLIPGKINLPYPAEDLFWAIYRKQK